LRDHCQNPPDAALAPLYGRWHNHCVADTVPHSDPPRFCGLVLAAGRGSRMGGEVPKVLLPVAGRPMIQWVVGSLAQAGIRDICVVVSPAGDAVKAELGGSVVYAVQSEPRGSGDAALSARGVLEAPGLPVIVACGDSPLFTADTVARLMHGHEASGAVVTLAAAELDDPSGYGRIVRDEPSGRISAVVEERNATDDQRSIQDVNGGLYAFDASFLWRRLAQARKAGREGEFVLTELVSDAVREGLPVESVPCSGDEVLGVNTPEQLQAAAAILASRAGRGTQVL